MSDIPKSFKDTLTLPTTTFPIRAQASSKEPELLERWQREQLDQKTGKQNEGKKKFILHDGPPYSNASIHLGTALNKILKDIVIKSRRMAGYHTPFLPGWDCHGLPIELKVTAETPLPSAPTVEQKIAFKKACRAFVQRWIEVQKKEFKALGVFGDWEHFYATLQPGYEAVIVKAFAQFVRDGYIERKGKTVPWCASCKTVLAHAEIEYHDRKDPSLYVLFPLPSSTVNALLSDIAKRDPSLSFHVAIWTTTPWTLPLNRAVILHPTARYALVRGPSNKAFIIAEQLAATFCDKANIPYEILGTINASALQGHKVCHPFIENLEVPLICDQSVQLEQGTACVHCAPGCGPEDYLIGVRNGLEIFSPVSPAGTYTSGIKPHELEGMSIKDALGWVIGQLKERGALLYSSTLLHSYPHCWRCKQGLLFRATDQWFCSLEKNDLVKKTLQELTTISFVPDWGARRLYASIANRTEWCISRQREWGTPIVALFCKSCQAPYLNAQFIEHVAEQIAQEGIEYWDRMNVADSAVRVICEKCGNQDPSLFKKENDILDVWFDAGVSHYAVLKNNENIQFPADLYLEGSDQHRGWFQSSLLTAMVLYQQAPMKAILTHGYIVDEKGHKMSKSLGNVIAPQDVIKTYSTDILRLWVASTDSEKDMVISEKLLKNVAEVYHNIRNRCRFMLANLYDFSFPEDRIPYEKLSLLDQHALYRLWQIQKQIQTAYEEYRFTLVYQLLGQYCAIDLSALYLDIIKDRLYVEEPAGLRRRSAQTVMYYILEALSTLMAPILSFLAEEVSDHYQPNKKDSIHLELFAPLLDEAGENPYTAQWELLYDIRSAVLKAIEGERERNTIKHSLEAKLTLHYDQWSKEGALLHEFIQHIAEREQVARFFTDWFIVSQIDIAPSDKQAIQKAVPLSWLHITVERAVGTKCPRCWQWETTTDSDGLCRRCQRVIYTSTTAS